MPLQNADLLIEQADSMLEAASQELDRAREDVTAFMVCYNSRQSLINYLSSYLIRNNIEITNPVTLSGLLEQCLNEDGRFEMIDISQIHCSHDDSDEAYCMNINKVTECLEIARIARNIVVNDSPTH